MFHSPAPTVLAFLLLSALLGACAPQPEAAATASGQEAAGGSAASVSSSSTASTPATSAPTASAHTGHAGHGGGSALASLQGEAFDRAFLSMMIPHHEGAIAMSQPALNSADPQVRAWAEAIVRTQEAELSDMRSMLQPLGGPDEAAAASMQAEMDSMTAHSGHAADPDRAFVEGMVGHHQSAVDMARLAEGRSQNPDVLALARRIAAAQEKEIAEFRAYLDR